MTWSLNRTGKEAEAASPLFPEAAGISGSIAGLSSAKGGFGGSGWGMKAWHVSPTVIGCA